MTEDDRTTGAGFRERILRQFGEVPFFLRHAIGGLCGLPEISLRDVFWVAGQREPLHPALVGASFVIVDRRKKRPRLFRHKPSWQQPIFVLMRRDGSYVLASCSLENKTIVVHPYVEGFVRPRHFRNGVDANVVGQVVTVVRAFSPPL